ncbi:hypothetical protein E2C01_021686 [Portunus trituberculatus]|uniref:Uncharacterized protein n=1 Tax=Portunus trituberculatus TaxID=210409 RepID=A0A5B7E3D6_PORTR|nr:hypothetical protein [Portunus trituberculatus]
MSMCCSSVISSRYLLTICAATVDFHHPTGTSLASSADPPSSSHFLKETGSLEQVTFHRFHDSHTRRATHYIIILQDVTATPNTSLSHSFVSPKLMKREGILKRIGFVIFVTGRPFRETFV